MELERWLGMKFLGLLDFSLFIEENKNDVPRFF